MKKFLRITILALLVACFFALVGCSSGDGYVDDGGVGGSDFVYSGRKISYTVDLTLTVTEVTAINKAVDEKVAQMEGYIEFANDSYSGSDVDYSSRTYRVPTENLNEFIEFVESQGNISRKYISSYDFTQDYVNATSRKVALTNKRNTLAELLNDSAVTASDKLVIINEIAYVDEQLELINTTISDYDATADFSTVYVDFNTLPSVIEILAPFIILLVTPAIVLGAIFIPKAILKRKREKQLREQECIKF